VSVSTLGVKGGQNFVVEFVVEVSGGQYFVCVFSVEV
jgi:hypothetical protein